MILSSLLLAQADPASSDGVLSGIAQNFSGIALRMGVDGPRLTSQIILFLVVAFCLRRFAYEPLLKVLDQRKATIKESVENAAKIKTELASAQKQRQEIIRQANETSTQMIEEAKKIADLTAQKRLEEAAREAERHLTDAREMARQERERMIEGVRKEMLRLVVDATGRATGKVLTSQDQERIKNETLVEASRN